MPVYRPRPSLHLYLEAAAVLFFTGGVARCEVGGCDAEGRNTVLLHIGVQRAALDQLHLHHLGTSGNKRLRRAQQCFKPSKVNAEAHKTKHR